MLILHTTNRRSLWWGFPKPMIEAGGEKVKVVFNSDEDKHALSNFIKATKDSPKKFYSKIHDGSDEPSFIVRAYAPSRNTTYYFEGTLMNDDMLAARIDEDSHMEEVYNVFEDAGFVEVKKIVED